MYVSINLLSKTLPGHGVRFGATLSRGEIIPLLRDATGCWGASPETVTVVSEHLRIKLMLSRTCTQHLELVWRNVMPIAMVKGWSPYIRSSIQRDSSLLGLLAKLATTSTTTTIFFFLLFLQ